MVSKRRSATCKNCKQPFWKEGNEEICRLCKEKDEALRLGAEDIEKYAKGQMSKEQFEKLHLSTKY